mmetsp:Transcript_101395/g.295415  ORF Transcript_101395/g.295415 Transcript_101395/m.295415 type:complete len:235 (+) Transcript_101395:401-1105(+)
MFCAGLDGADAAEMPDDCKAPCGLEVGNRGAGFQWAAGEPLSMGCTACLDLTPWMGLTSGCAFCHAWSSSGAESVTAVPESLELKLRSSFWSCRGSSAASVAMPASPTSHARKSSVRARRDEGRHLVRAATPASLTWLQAKRDRLRTSRPSGRPSPRTVRPALPRAWQPKKQTFRFRNVFAKFWPRATAPWSPTCSQDSKPRESFVSVCGKPWASFVRLSLLTLKQSPKASRRS